jgi:two-component system chemotaxis sensor kinase CheA
MNKDRLAARLLEAFLGELDEQLRAMNADLLALEAAPGDANRLKSVFRVAHTLKGAARAAGVPLVEKACHALESLLVEAREGKRKLGADELALLFSAVDALADSGRRLRAKEDPLGAPLATLLARLGLSDGPLASHPPAPAPPPAAPAAPKRGDGQVRIETEKLDALFASAGQLLTANARAAARPAEIAALHDLAMRSTTELRRAGHRLRLALERAGAPQADVQAVTALEHVMRRFVLETGRMAFGVAEDARALARTTGEVMDRARRLRMRPFTDACEALPRAVRDLATASGKQVQLAVIGGEVEADRSVLDALREPLVHLVRNAVDHGIEPPKERERAGKPRHGTVRVAAALRGDRLLVTVADDGAGLNVEAIRSQLTRGGMTGPESDRELARLLFQSGVTTRARPTEISGRGVGLDIVRTAVERIGGSVDVAWESGSGTAFTLDCPVTLATVRAVLVAVGPQALALPTAYVERLLRVRLADIKHAEGRPVIAVGEVPVPLVPLARLLPRLAEKPASDPVPVVLLAAGDRRLAVAVDELIAEQEVLVQPLERLTHPLPHLSGGALLGTGRVALVLNPPALIDAGLQLPAGVELPAAEVAAARAAKRRILVVDDSITTRTLEQSILEAAGYDVLTAVDGADGWRALQERGCDLIVADIEMPRMDGFALCEAVRGSKRFKEVPIVLVTAMETAEHRARGLEVGADAYIGKSSFDQQNLLDIIRQLLG